MGSARFGGCGESRASGPFLGGKRPRNEWGHSDYTASHLLVAQGANPSLIVVLANLLADIAYAILDPRSRQEVAQ